MYKYILNFHGSDITFNTSIRKVYSFFLKKIIIKYPIVIPSKYYEDIFLNQFKKEKEKLQLQKIQKEQKEEKKSSELEEAAA